MDQIHQLAVCVNSPDSSEQDDYEKMDVPSANASISDIENLSQGAQNGLAIKVKNNALTSQGQSISADSRIFGSSNRDAFLVQSFRYVQPACTNADNNQRAILRRHNLAEKPKVDEDATTDVGGGGNWRVVIAMNGKKLRCITLTSIRVVVAFQDTGDGGNFFGGTWLDGALRYDVALLGCPVRTDGLDEDGV
ncbi:MAG: hypothetical protein Q9171_002497 [Xanthocarpia ochracea]